MAVKKQRKKVINSDSQNMMKGMMDMTKMAVAGTIGIGMIGAVGSIIKK